MSEKIKVVIDAMGGDNAPSAPVEGALDALKEIKDLEIILVGTKEPLDAELAKHEYDKSRVKCVYSTQVIVTGEAPVTSIQKKKDSSLVVALNLIKNGEADAVISSGNTGSVLVGGQVIIKKAKGVYRAPLAPLIPTEKGVSLLIDCGANVDARPEHLQQFAVMGSVYMRRMMGVENPTVGLVSVGEEKDKGNKLVHETYPLLEADPNINFIGNIEANRISEGAADVIVTEAFTGNVILKMYEGVSKTLLRVLKETMMSSAKTKIGALMIKGALKEKMKTFDSDRYGAAPLLGLTKLLLKSHGSAKASSFTQAIRQAVSFVENDMVAQINEALDKITNK